MTPAARLLDITRLSSRIGRVFTGVDRVELAYLRAIHADPVLAFAVSRTALGYVLLDDAGIGRFLTLIETDNWPRPDFVSRVNHRLSDASKVGQTVLRNLSIQRCLHRNLPKMLQEALPAGFAYLNVGHSNLTDAMLSAIKGLPDAQISILVHDTIPLDFPQYQRPGTVEQFAAKLARVSTYADLVICISSTGQSDVTRHMEEIGRVPQMLSAHLGVDVAEPDEMPANIPCDRPYFITVGTIEPRKNHMLLLDVWSQLPDDGPRLFICGSRGWNNETVFMRLDAGVAGVVELRDLSDGVLSALTKGAQASLFPTFAEGFGLPPSEALALGTPVICSDLPVLRETLGHNAVYLDPGDVYQWKTEVTKLADADRSQGTTEYTPPTWDVHFKNVFTMT